jgi:hypothetical protein
VRFEWLYEVSVAVIYPVTLLLIVGAGELANWIGFRSSAAEKNAADFGTLAGAALGLLALLLAFAFAIALARFDARRDLALAEANAIGSAANYSLMLPEPARTTVLGLMRDYAAVRVGLGVPYDPAKLQRDIARSLELQSQLWREAVAVAAAAPQSLPVYQFVGSLNEMNNVHEARLTALRAHIPAEVMLVLLFVSLMAIGFAGYHAGVNGSQRRLATLLMAFTIAALVAMIIDLDRPARGLIQVPVQPLVDAADSLPK